MNEMMQMILDELKAIRSEQQTMNRRLDTIENGQNDMRSEMNDMRSEMKVMNRRLDTLEEGQKAIRRDIARVDQKIDQLSLDVGSTLSGTIDSVDNELKLIRNNK